MPTGLILLALWAASPALALTYSVTNVNDSGAGSLRQAILDANGHAGADVISFAIGSGAKTILLSSFLPALTEPTTIDGTTQPGYAGTPLIEIDGNAKTGSSALLLFHGGSSSVKGLVLNNFGGDGIRFRFVGSNLVTNCFIGTNAAGTAAKGNTGVGIVLESGTGSTTIGGGTSTRNVISGNGAQGIYVSAGVTGVVIKGNYVGVNAAGNAAIGNGQWGIDVAGTAQVGGTAAGEGNVVSANASGGIQLSGNGCSAYANAVGTNAARTAALAPKQPYGIRVYGTGATVGSTSGPNVVSGNQYGLALFATGASTGSTVAGNYIGVSSTGFAAIPNDYGIRMLDGGGYTFTSNVISGNTNYALSIGGAGGNTLTFNYVGTNAGGDGALPNGSGITVSSPGNKIGDVSAGNLISGNTGHGIVFSGVDADNNTVSANQIGLDLNGFALGNGGTGIYVNGGSGNTIGGTTLSRRNFVSSNGGDGILLGGDGGHVVQGNYIGVDVLGGTAMGNAGYGIAVYPANCTIGGPVSGAGNVISANGGRGISAAGTAVSLVIQGNRIGTNAAGTAALGNGSYAIVADGGSTILGGTTATSRNLISGNVDGVILGGTGGNIAQGNFIGTNAAGTAALPNGGGMRVYGANNTIGGVVAGAGNLISGNTGGGLSLAAGSSASTVQGNRIGTDVTGTLALVNGGTGLLVDGSGHTIGAASAAARNQIVGGNAAMILSGSSHVVKGNYLGFNTAGSAHLGTDGGLTIYGTGSTVGGPNAGEGNLFWAGALSSGAASNTLQGNIIGLDATGTTKLANGSGIGLRIITSNDNQVGGSLAGAGNVISGHLRGITLEYGSTGNVIQGNFLGTNKAGTAAIPNLEEGIDIGAPANTIGGAVPGAGNVISGQTNSYGIWIRGGDAVGNKIWGNRIGVAADGVTPLSNLFGVLVTGSFDNEIGGVDAGKGNVIASNGYQGVRVSFGNGNSIRGNSISGHPGTGAGIDLDPLNANPNDALDADLGANRGQNFPILQSASISAGNTTVLGVLPSKPSTQYTLDFYGNTVCHPSGMGEGKTYLSTKNVTTDGAGNAAINAVIPTGAPGAFVTAIATDPEGNSSEFSPCVATTGPNPGTLQFAVGLQNELESVGSALVKVTRSGGFQGTVSVHYATSDDGATAPSDYTATSGDLTFGPTDAVKTFLVPIVLDDTPEAGTERIQLTLSAPTAGAALGAQSTSKINLIDYGKSLPTLFVSDESIVEGNSGTKTMTFTVTITPHTGSGSFQVRTYPGDAHDGEDYDLVDSVTIPFGPNDATKTVDVTIHGDTMNEPDEAFYLRIDQVTNCTVSKAQGEGIILNDDGGLRGDADGSGQIQVADVFYMINALFAGGTQPSSVCLGDANNDATFNVQDVFYLINYLFAGGTAPTPPGC